MEEAMNAYVDLRRGQVSDHFVDINKMINLSFFRRLWI